VGLLHCNVGGDPNHDLYSPCTVDDLRDFGLDYWALGHIHARRVLHEGDPWVVYPGNLQGRSPKPSELGPKGAVIVEVDGGTAAAPEFIELDRVRFEQVLVDIAGLGDLADAQKALRDAGRELQQESADRSLLLRGVLTGGGPLHTDLRREGVVKELLRSLRDEEGEVLPFVWWDRVEDVTRPEVDFDTLKGRGDFLAEVLALAEEVDADVEARRVFAEDHLANLPGARLQRLVGELPNAAGEAAWRTAVDRAVDLLLEDGAA
jgi:DNA repair exonuclease SbcCD nuclease subunit